MSNLFVVVKDPNASFSEQNPEIHLIAPYSSLYEKEGKEQYDRIMMAIYLVYDPKSKLNATGRRSERDKRKDVVDNYLKKSFPWTKYKKIVTKYQDDFRTFLEKKLENFKRELDEREQYMIELTWDEDSTKKDKMMLNHDQYMKKYLDIKKEVDAERSDISSRGGTKLSRTERRILNAEGG